MSNRLIHLLYHLREKKKNSICSEIFGHIFSNVLNAEEHHDFSKEEGNLSNRLIHLLYHLREKKNDIIVLLSGESSDLFMGYFKKYLEQLFREYQDSYTFDVPTDFVINQKNDIIVLLSGESSDLFMGYFKKYLEQLFREYQDSYTFDVPTDFVINHYVSSFADDVRWWIRDDMRTSPEKVVEYYNLLTNN